MPGGSWRSGESSNTVRTEGGSDPGQQYTGDECRSREGRVESASRVRWEVEASKSVRPRAAGQSLARARRCLQSTGLFGRGEGDRSHRYSSRGDTDEERDARV